MSKLHLQAESVNFICLSTSITAAPQGCEEILEINTAPWTALGSSTRSVDRLSCGSESDGNSHQLCLRIMMEARVDLELEPKARQEQSGKNAKTSKQYVDQDSLEPRYRSDAFRISSYKVVPCSKRYSHDWTICPYAHPGEKARRRDPQVYNYAGIACPDMKKGGFCSNGDKCPYAHNVFEYWLHPTRYRTQLCNDGVNCNRHVCFFAHTLEQMRPNKPEVSLEQAAREIHKEGAASPDTPFMQANNSLPTSSTASSELWSALSPEDCARSNALEDSSNTSPVQPGAAGSRSVDDLASGLASVKLAMSGDKRNEVINLLTQLLQEAVEEKNQAKETSRVHSGQAQARGSHEAEFVQALSALDRSQAQSLLASTQRRYLASRLQDPTLQQEHKWLQIIQDMLDVSPGMPTFANTAMRRQSCLGNPLFTAPAALDMASAGLPAAVNASADHSQLPVSDLASRGFSADLGMPAFATQPRSLWPQSGVAELSGIPRNLPRAPSSNQIVWRMSGDAEVGQLGPTTLLEGGLLAERNMASANPQALRRQSFNLEEPPRPPPPPRREVRRPPVSAFQHVAIQDWSNTGARNVSGDLSWANSGHTLSGDLGTITEAGLPPLRPSNLPDFLGQHQHTDHGWSRDASAGSMDRSRSTGLGGFETGFNLLHTPLSFPATQPEGRDPTQLHSAPYNMDRANVGWGRMDSRY